MKALPVPVIQFSAAASQKVCADVVGDCCLGSGLKEVMVENC